MENMNFKLNYSVRNWNLLYLIAKQDGFSDLREWLTFQLLAFPDKIHEKKPDDCPDCNCIMKPNIFTVPGPVEDAMRLMSDRYCEFPGGFIKKFIVDPALHNKIQTIGF